MGGLTEVLANNGVQAASESVPQGGTLRTVMIGTFRMVPCTFSTLQMYSFWTGDDSIAIAAGVTRDDAINRREHENLDWRDANIASTNWLAWKYRT